MSVMGRKSAGIERGDRDTVTLRRVSCAFVGSLLLSGLIGCTGGSPIPGFVPSPEDLEAFNASLETLPSVSVRVVNETTVPAEVRLVAGVEGFGSDFFPGEDFLNPVDTPIIVVAAGGTVDGSVTCGEVIGIAVSAPADRDETLYESAQFGLFVGGGNVALSGLGVGSDGAFTGDVVATSRFVRPVEGDLDCAVERIVITIESVGTISVYDPLTGALVHGSTLGSGRVSGESTISAATRTQSRRHRQRARE